jgi:hypothetical protein
MAHAFGRISLFPRRTSRKAKVAIRSHTLSDLRGNILLFIYLIRESKRLLGDGFKWSVCAAGRFQFSMGVVNVIEGGFWRVGLEDNLYLKEGVLAKSSAEQVEKAVRIIRELGYEPAGADEAREILELKGFSCGSVQVMECCEEPGDKPLFFLQNRERR